MSDRYTIKGKIGEGGVGSVYRAFDNTLKRDVAIKRLLSEDHKPQEERRSAEVLIKEAGMLSKLQHPNIVTVYDVGIDDDGGYVVMELIEGETFDKTIARGALTTTDFSHVVDQTLEAMIAAQQIGMLHRDIKPSNVMVSWLPSGRFQVKVLDFGLAKLSKTPALQTVNHGDSIMGSIYFMAPEQFDRDPLDARTDLYSLGCLYYYGLTGKYPFDGDSAPDVMIAHLEGNVKPLNQIRNDLSPELCDWVMRLISKNKDDRPASAKIALKEFSPILQSTKKAVPTETSPVPKVSPNRPQLITGPVEQLRNYSAPLHTTGYQMQRKKSATSSYAIIVWSLCALTILAAAGWWWQQSKNPKVKQADVFAPNLNTDPNTAATPTPRTLTPRTLIKADATWRYLDFADTPKNWNQNYFDDQSWPRGNSPLGFGDPVATTLRLGDTPDDRRITYYFRKTIELDALATEQDNLQLTARIRYDDGFRLFINGKEALRVALPKGDIWKGTAAYPSRDGEKETAIVEFPLPLDVLKLGKNVFAVEVHQSRKTSSDLAWAMALDYEPKSSSP